MVNSRIKCDKQLWCNLLDRVCEERRIALPSYRRALEDSTAEQVESLLRTATNLSNNYALGCPAIKFQSNFKECVTWLKLVRGRWCLMATSNTSRSRLSVFDSNGGIFRLAEEVYLPGPVMDGLIEDTGRHIRTALSVGTRSAINPLVRPQT